MLRIVKLTISGAILLFIWLHVLSSCSDQFTRTLVLSVRLIAWQFCRKPFNSYNFNEKILLLAVPIHRCDFIWCKPSSFPGHWRLKL